MHAIALFNMGAILFKVILHSRILGFASQVYTAPNNCDICTNAIIKPHV